MRHSIPWLLMGMVLGGAACSGETERQPAPAPAGTARVMERPGERPTADRAAFLQEGAVEAADGKDDLGRHIDALPDTPAQKSALRQLRRALDAILAVDTSDPVALRAVAAGLSDAVHCAWSVYPPETAPKRVEEMRRRVVNTRERLEAYAKYNQARSGAVVALPAGDSCR